MRTSHIAAVLLLLPTLAGAADKPQTVKLDGVLEFRKGEFLIVDGQRVKAQSSTKVKGTAAAKIPLGYMMKVKGTRDAQGTVLATEIESKENKIEGIEPKLLAATDMAESTWVAAGKIVETDENGKESSMGALHKTGPEVDRVRKIVDRVMPPYINRADVRVYVVDNKEWNAMAMANYSIYVFSGIMNDMDDDELAIVLGHEIAHASHEHSRRQATKSTISGIAGEVANMGAGMIGNDLARQAAQSATALGVTTFGNVYSRDYEDQADRIGLRYVYEAGFDVNKAPALWKKFTAKYGDQSKVENFFFGNH